MIYPKKKAWSDEIHYYRTLVNVFLNIFKQVALGMKVAFPLHLISVHRSIYFKAFLKMINLGSVVVFSKVMVFNNP